MWGDIAVTVGYGEVESYYVVYYINKLPLRPYFMRRRFKMSVQSFKSKPFTASCQIECEEQEKHKTNTHIHTQKQEIIMGLAPEII